MLKFLENRGLFQALLQFCQKKPVFGTCAGAICWPARSGTPRSAASAPWMPLWSAMPMDARSTPLSSPSPPPFPALPWRWSSSALRASPRSEARSRFWLAARLARPGSSGKPARRHLPPRTIPGPPGAQTVRRYGDCLPCDQVPRPQLDFSLAEQEEFGEICDRSTDKCVFDHLARILVRPIMGGSNLYSTEALNARYVHARPSGN